VMRRELARCKLAVPRRLGVDETSFQKRHEYVTVVADLEGGVVQHVADGTARKRLSQPPPFSQRHLLPSRWTRPLPSLSYPLGFLKSHPRLMQSLSKRTHF